VGAYGGRADVMAMVAPLGPVYQAGTLSGNPLATAAGLATLELLNDAAYATLRSNAQRLGHIFEEHLAAAGVASQVLVVSSLVGVYVGKGDAPVDYAGAKTTDEKQYARLFHGLLDNGVAMAPGAYEVLFPGLAHTDEVLDEIDSALAAAEL
jgi:glutamate-1-semialdehyde 2,1-aminomutase